MKKIIIALAILVFAVGCSNSKKGYTEISYASFNKKIKNEESFIFYIGAEDCHYCKNFAVTLKEVAKNYPKIDFKYLDISKITKEESVKLSSMFHFEGTPTTIFIKKGKEESVYNRIDGAKPYDKVIEILKKNDYIK